MIKEAEMARVVRKVFPRLEKTGCIHRFVVGSSHSIEIVFPSNFDASHEVIIEVRTGDRAQPHTATVFLFGTATGVPACSMKSEDARTPVQLERILVRARERMRRHLTKAVRLCSV